MDGLRGAKAAVVTVTERVRCLAPREDPSDPVANGKRNRAGNDAGQQPGAAYISFTINNFSGLSS